MSVRQSAASTEFVTIGPVTTGQADPTTDDVDMAFMAAGETPEEADWTAAEWNEGPPNYVRRLVAGEDVFDPPISALVLGRGTYVVWVRIFDNPEMPARPADVLVVY